MKMQVQSTKPTWSKVGRVERFQQAACEVRNSHYDAQFFKTKLCVFWQTNECSRGENCKYAHGIEQLRSAPDLARTAMCNYMVQYGVCDNPNCKFAHTADELRATDDFLQTKMQSTKWVNPPAVDEKECFKGMSADVRNSHYDAQFHKTKLCTFWQNNCCLRGADCKYAHGKQELQSAPDLAKTALCNRMAQDGVCDDPTCKFAHSTDELRATDMFLKTTMCKFQRHGTCKLGDKCRHAHSLDELRPPVADEQDGQVSSHDSTMTPDVQSSFAGSDLDSSEWETQWGRAASQPAPVRCHYTSTGRVHNLSPVIPTATSQRLEDTTDVELNQGSNRGWGRTRTEPAALPNAEGAWEAMGPLRNRVLRESWRSTRRGQMSDNQSVHRSNDDQTNLMSDMQSVPAANSAFYDSNNIVKLPVMMVPMQTALTMSPQMTPWIENNSSPIEPSSSAPDSMSIMPNHSMEGFVCDCGVVNHEADANYCKNCGTKRPPSSTAYSRVKNPQEQHGPQYSTSQFSAANNEFLSPMQNVQFLSMHSSAPTAVVMVPMATPLMIGPEV